MPSTTEQEIFYAKISNAKEKAQKQYLGHYGVTGMGIGFKVRDGIKTNQVSIVFFVEKKKDVSQISMDALLPTSIDGYPVDVVENSLEFADDPELPISIVEAGALPDTKRYNPILGGISISRIQTTSNPRVGAGTLGIIVHETGIISDTSLMLTNAHVLPSGGDEVSQPASILNNGDVCATLKNTFMGNYSYKGKNYYVDAATAKRNFLAREFSLSQIEEIGPVSGSGLAVVGDQVRKRGAITGLTSGTVTYVDVTRTLTGLCENIILIKSNNPGQTFSDAGDSGSVIVRQDSPTQVVVVGLLFAALIIDPETSAACAILPVLEKMGVKI